VIKIIVPPIKVYLSGHMHYDEHNWRPHVMSQLEDEEVQWLLPKKLVEDYDETEEHAKIYVPRDKLSIRQCDVVFAFVEDGIGKNVGTNWECGFADGLGKIVLVANTCKNDRSYDFISAAADASFGSLTEGINASGES